MTARPTGPVEPMAPTDLFRCEKYRCALMAQACVARQSEPMLRGSQEWMKRPKYEFCASGECSQGALVKLRLGAFKPARSRNEQLLAERRAVAHDELAAIELRIESRPSAAEIADAVEQQQEERAAPLPPAPPPQPPAPPPEKREEPMPGKTCPRPRCGRPLRSDNTKGICGDCQNGKTAHLKPEGKPATTSAPAPKPERKLRAGAKPRPADTPSTGVVAETRTRVDLPAIADLPFEYLLLCVEYARKAQRRLSGALGNDQVHLEGPRSAA